MDVLHHWLLHTHAVAVAMRTIDDDSGWAPCSLDQAPQPTPFGHNWRRGKRCTRTAKYLKHSKKMHYELPETF